MTFAPRHILNDIKYKFTTDGVIATLYGKSRDVLYWNEIGECHLRQFDEITYLTLDIKGTWLNEIWSIPLFSDTVGALVAEIHSVAPADHPILMPLKQFLKENA